MAYVFVVPHYNHFDSFQKFLPRLLATELPCIVVDDGSNQEVKKCLQNLLADYPQVELIEHLDNRGKGAAMLTGAAKARKLGYSYMIQIDADGQHDVGDTVQLIKESEAFPNAIISGLPIYGKDAPKARVYGRKITDFWVAIETWSLSIKESLCGFRVYPLDELERVCRRFGIGQGMTVDTDLIVKSSWLGIAIRFVDTKVVYLPDNRSHFHYLKDNIRLIGLHIKLMLGMLIRAPYWLARAILEKLK